MDPSEGGYGCLKTHFLVKNAFLEKCEKKLTKSTERIGDVGLVENFKKHPERASEVSSVNSYKISSLKATV